MKVESKKWYQSKLVWSGVVAVIASIGMMATGEATIAEALLGAEGLLAVLLRLITTKPIA